MKKPPQLVKKTATPVDDDEDEVGEETEPAAMEEQQVPHNPADVYVFPYYLVAIGFCSYLNLTRYDRQAEPEPSEESQGGFNLEITINITIDV